MYNGGRYDESIELCSECLRFDPTYVFAVQIRGLCYLAKAMRGSALSDLEHAASLIQRTPFYLGLLGYGYGEFGMRAEALGLIEELNHSGPDTYVAPQCYVYIYAGLGEKEHAM